MMHIKNVSLAEKMSNAKYPDAVAAYKTETPPLINAVEKTFFFVKHFADCNEYTAENVYKQAFEKVRHMKISVSAHKDYTDYEKENTCLAEHV